MTRRFGTNWPIVLVSRRLSLAGYFVWFRGLAPLAGSSVSETVRCLVSSRAAKYICILSPEALTDPDFTARRFAAQAAGLQRDESLVLPALARQIDPTTLDQDTKKLSFADFSGGWAHGLDDVEKVLAATNCPRKPDGAGQQVLRSYVPTELVSNEPESLASNLFQVVRVPPAILRFYSTAPLLDEEGPLASKWAFRKVTDTHFLSFHRPPANLMREFGLTAKGGSVWNSQTEFDGIEVRDLIKELLKKSINAECRRRGLVYCPDRKVTYFPEGLLKNEFLRFRDAAGVPQSFTVTGERKYGRGDRATMYRYQTAPVFVPIGSFADGYEIILRIRVRLFASAWLPRLLPSIRAPLQTSVGSTSFAGADDHLGRAGSALASRQMVQSIC